MSVIGLRVGPFEIVGPAQVPTEGAWYRAKRAGMTRRQPEEVLVRVLREDAEGPERAALQSAFHNLRAVEDPRIPTAVAIYEGVGAMAIDVPEGASFSDIVEARAKGTIALTPATLLDLALEVAETLQHAHHRNRHHGHLEPDNLRLTPMGKVFLFGFEDPTAPASALWRSPESARNEPLSAATDQWALAASMAALITGARPWSETHSAQDADISHLVSPIEEQWPALARLLRRMLDANPQNRFASMHPVRQELLALARKAKGTSERVELGRAMARRLGRSAADGATEIFRAPDTSAETLVARQEPAPTEAAMDLPEAGLEPPSERPKTPLVEESIAPVAPEIDGDLPRIGQQEEPIPKVFPPSDADLDDFDDELPGAHLRTVVFPDAHLAGDIDVSLPEDFDEDDGVGVGLTIPPAGAATAVPVTDPDAGEINSLVDTVPPPIRATPRPSQVPTVPMPDISEAETLEYEPDPVPPKPSAFPVQRVVPVLIGAMLLLMVIWVATRFL